MSSSDMHYTGYNFQSYHDVIKAKVFRLNLLNCWLAV